jgi:glutathione-regulated potassium-efflux system protein KefB
MAAKAVGVQLGQAVALLACSGGSVLGYLTAGLVAGHFGLRVVSDTQVVLHVAELSVVLFLFPTGLEMRPARLWGLRGQIFGLEVAQVLACGGTRF